jgi:hypothetical protein
MNGKPNHQDARDSQILWAKMKGLDPQRGYFADLNANLWRPLSPNAHRAFARGSGSEIAPREGSPPKMCALHSSAALAVNVFDFWQGRSLTPLLRSFQVDGAADSFEFEAQLRTGARGIPPNLDVLFHLSTSGLLGVESKFTEWMTPKNDMGGSLAPYVDTDSSFWSRADLPACDRLARDLVNAEHPRFRFLDVPQLLKHALGLRRAAQERAWHLRYLYLDYPCSARDAHEREIADFSSAVGHELNFHAQSYQSFLASIDLPGDPEFVRYREYLRDRYLKS